MNFLLNIFKLLSIKNISLNILNLDCWCLILQNFSKICCTCITFSQHSNENQTKPIVKTNTGKQECILSQSTGTQIKYI